ncbi:hypothetical protein AcW1_000596 [Taiwanofungus camphoratus]|nr:hypothetical protein AcW1_000596 [Antrodia cinnamomea]
MLHWLPVVGNVVVDVDSDVLILTSGCLSDEGAFIMTFKKQIDLPEIPTLPPIQMPEASDFSPASPLYPHLTKVLSSRHPSPSPFTSQDTSLTAATSLSLSPSSSPSLPDSNGNTPGNTTSFAQDRFLPHSPHSLTPPTSLRKSISVDSFIKYKQPPSPATQTARPPQLVPLEEARPRAYGSTTSSDLASSAPRVPPRERDRRVMPPPPTPSRSRGTSVSATADEREGSSFFEESDAEHSEDRPPRSRKSKSRVVAATPAPGELHLPSRLQSTNSFPNMNTSEPPAPIIPIRSSSLGHKLAKQKSLMSVDTHIPPPPPPAQIIIAVIGALGCGKSTVIRKGLKAYGLSEPTVATISASPAESREDALTYTYRTGRLCISGGPDRLLRVLEIDFSTLDLSQCGSEMWPDGKSTIDGVLLCYDTGREETFDHIAEGLHEFAHLKLPTIALACKSDLPKRVDPLHAATILQEFDVGLVEVTTASDNGKDKIRKAFEWMLKVIVDGLQPILGSARTERDGYRNPASPSVLGATPPWDISRASSATPTAASTASLQTTYPHSSSHSSSHTQSQAQVQVQPPLQSHSQVGTPVPSRGFHLPSSSPVTARTPSTPTSPTRARSTSDLLSEHEKSKREEREQHSGGRAVLNSPSIRSRGSLNALSGMGSNGDGSNVLDDSNEASREVSVRESRAPPWMTLEELLNKLLFIAVSDDDPIFISHFLLTYRRFATPRSILLAMQKRMRALDQPSGDPMFACYAQIMICRLLDNWITLFPNDFAVPGAASALNALIRSILSKTYLLHYGSDFLPFLELVSNLKDGDKAWALKVDEESDDSSVMSDEEGYPALEIESPVSSNRSSNLTGDYGRARSQGHPPPARDRKSSLPLTAKALVMGSSAISPTSAGQLEGSPEHSPKQILRKLVSISEELNKIDPMEIAQEITRIEAQFFLQIEPRHWLQHVLVQGKKDPETDPIAKYNHVSNHIADWVVSLILCHDKPKARARQIEKFVEVANRLRVLHNYSALRAVIAGINSATFEGDLSLEIFRTRSPEGWKTFQSWDQLLQSVRSHQKYRMALRNSKGACIPALEIHLSDLIRAHEGNSDYHDDDPTKIHWAKFNMMARFIDAITQCQKGCHESGGYEYPERKNVRQLLLLLEEDLLMDVEMQKSRIAPPDSESAEDGSRPPSVPRTYSRDYPQTKDAAILRKIFFW